MNKKTFKFFSLLVIMLISLSLSATKRYWTGRGANKNWNNTSNWSATSNGVTSASVPGSSDSVYFDGAATNKKCSLEQAINIKFITISGDTLTQNTYAITIGTSGGIFSGGTFIGGSANITNNGLFTLSGTTFTSTSANFIISGNYTFSSGTFAHNNGNVVFNATLNVSGSTNFYDLQFGNNSTNCTFTLDTLSTFNVSHLLVKGGSGLVKMNKGTINVIGDITLSNTFLTGGGTTVLEINGTGDQNFNGFTDSTKYNKGWLCNIKINKTSGTLYLKNTIVVSEKWEYVSGNVNSTTYNSTLSFIYSTSKITGTQSINNLIVAVYASSATILEINSSDTLKLEGWMKISSGTDARIIGKIDLKGDFITYNTSPYTSAGGGGSIRFMGTSDQMMIGQATSTYGRLCSIVIDKPSGTLYIKDHLRIGGNWLYRQGTVNATTYNSTITFANGTSKISGNHALNNVSFNASGYGVYDTIQASDTITVLGELQISGGNLVLINGGTINLKGDLTVTNSLNSVSGGGTATILMTGNGTQTITGYTTPLAGRLCNLIINKPSADTVLLKNIVTIGSSNNWKLLSGIVDGVTHNSTLYFSRGNHQIKGTQKLYNLTLDSEALTTRDSIYSSDTLKVYGLLKIIGTAALSIQQGTINAHGDILVTNTSSGVTVSTGLINICGIYDQSLTGNGVAASGRLCHVRVDKPSGNLNLYSIITVSGNWTFLRGNVNPGSSTFISYGVNMSPNINCVGTSSNMDFNIFKVYNGGTTTLSGNLYVSGNLAIGTSGVLAANSKTIFLSGNWNNAGTFSYANTTVNFNGIGAQYLTKTSGTETFHTFGVNKPSGVLHLTKPISVTSSLVMTSGIIASTATNIINLPDNATSGGGNDSSYVCGPIKKTGNDAFTFPLGDTTLLTAGYHPLSITAPSNATDAYTAQYFPTNQTYGSTIQTDSLDAISNCEYWLLTRNTGSSTVIPTLGWNTNSCNIYGVYDIAVAGWNGTQWNKLGKSAATFGTGKGTISALTGISAASLPLAIGNPIQKNATSECVLKKKLDAGYYTLYNGFLKFKFDEEYVNNGSELEFKIYDKNRTIVISDASVGATLNIVNKDNRWGINVKAINPSLPTGYYILEVKDRKGEISMLRFKI